MKKFVIKVFLFIVAMIFADLLFGKISFILRENSKGGSTANNYYISENLKDDLVILGSSRATHHYISKMIEDSLGITCYNCGEEGNGIILAYGRYKMITDHHIPKYVIYQVTPEYDWFTYEDNSKYVRYLRPYSYMNDIYKLITDVCGNKEKIKLRSNMYNNNSSILTYMVDNVIFRDNMKGYSPLYDILDTIEDEENNYFDLPIDNYKLSLLKLLIQDTKKNGIQLLFVESPYANISNSSKNYEAIIELCDEYKIPFLDLRNIDGITGNTDYFNDGVHLNHSGAEKYTRYFITKFKELNNSH